jgi:hypothetical protein
MHLVAGSEEPHSSPDRVSDLRFLLALVLLFAVPLARAGGPHWVAGSGYFNAAARGHAIVWANGEVSYYTDLGNLSAQVNQAQANAMVATAVTVWNNVNTAAISI